MKVILESSLDNQEESDSPNASSEKLSKKS